MLSSLVGGDEPLPVIFGYFPISGGKGWLVVISWKWIWGLKFGFQLHSKETDIFILLYFFLLSNDNLAPYHIFL